MLHWQGDRQTFYYTCKCIDDSKHHTCMEVSGHSRSQSVSVIQKSGPDFTWSELLFNILPCTVCVRQMIKTANCPSPFSNSNAEKQICATVFSNPSPQRVGTSRIGFKDALRSVSSAVQIKHPLIQKKRCSVQPSLLIPTEVWQGSTIEAAYLLCACVQPHSAE